VTTDACLFGSLSPARSKEGGDMNVLDIGTGTGLLALMYAQKNPEAIIDAIEIDKDAAEQSKENVERSPWSKRINIIHSDARKFSFTKKYDLIISNPPFYENELKSNDNRKNIAFHSEELSLQELLKIVKTNLDPHGQFYLLLPNKRVNELAFLFGKNILEITLLTMVRQSVNHDIYRIFIKGKHPGNSYEDYKKNEIIIWDGSGQQYTPVFIELLKDFYLNL
jgi:tRNA1Val (adenine37-N6)-methyltransferase